MLPFIFALTFIWNDSPKIVPNCEVQFICGSDFKCNQTGWRPIRIICKKSQASVMKPSNWHFVVQYLLFTSTLNRWINCTVSNYYSCTTKTYFKRETINFITVVYCIPSFNDPILRAIYAEYNFFLSKVQKKLFVSPIWRRNKNIHVMIVGVWWSSISNTQVQMPGCRVKWCKSTLAKGWAYLEFWWHATYHMNAWMRW